MENKNVNVKDDVLLNKVVTRSISSKRAKVKLSDLHLTRHSDCEELVKL